MALGAPPRGASRLVASYCYHWPLIFLRSSGLGLAWKVILSSRTLLCLVQVHAASAARESRDDDSSTAIFPSTPVSLSILDSTTNSEQQSGDWPWAATFNIHDHNVPSARKKRDAHFMPFIKIFASRKNTSQSYQVLPPFPTQLLSCSLQLPPPFFIKIERRGRREKRWR